MYGIRRKFGLEKISLTSLEYFVLYINLTLRMWQPLPHWQKFFHQIFLQYKQSWDFWDVLTMPTDTSAAELTADEIFIVWVFVLC